MSGYGTIDKKENGKIMAFSMRKFVAGLCIFVLATLGIAVIVLSVIKDDEVLEPVVDPTQQLSPFQIANKSMVAADAAPCAHIGVDVMKDGGTAVDAAIAVLFCNGVVHSHSMGIGGGFLMTIYDSSSGQVFSLNARETAPLLSTSDMFGNNSDLAFQGPLSIAVPGEIAGYVQARERFGNLSIPWRRLIQPTIDMCRNGIPVTKTFEDTIKGFEFRNDELKQMLINETTGEFLKEGDTYTRYKLADTLDLLASSESGSAMASLFYSGDIAHNLVDDIADMGGQLSLEDLMNYRAEWSQPVQTHLKTGNLTIYSQPPPGSGAVLISILNIMEEFPDQQDDTLFYHRLVEAFKFAYGKRTLLGDPNDIEYSELIQETVDMMISKDWARAMAEKIQDDKTYENLEEYGGNFIIPQDHGTAHVTVVSEAGDAVSVTSTVNQEFGSGLISPSTGIILNDEMDDFSYPGFSNGFDLPPSPSNFVAPGKRPMSSMSPTIVLDADKKIVLGIGSAGGSRITTSTAMAIALQIFKQYNLKESIDAPRLHHQLYPNQISYQSEFSKEILNSLQAKGHKIHDRGSAGSTMNGISTLTSGGLLGVADYRKSSGVDGL